jgi:hypothetical protein
MMVTTGGRHGLAIRCRRLPAAIVLDRAFLQQLRLVAHLLDHDRRRFLVQHLVDGHHAAHASSSP